MFRECDRFEYASEYAGESLEPRGVWHGCSKMTPLAPLEPYSSVQDKDAARRSIGSYCP